MTKNGYRVFEFWANGERRTKERGFGWDGSEVKPGDVVRVDYPLFLWQKTGTNALKECGFTAQFVVLDLALSLGGRDLNLFVLTEEGKTGWAFLKL